MSKPKNKNAAHAVPPDTNLNIRCRTAHKSQWAAAADADGSTTSSWVVRTLNSAAFNELYAVGTAIEFNGRQTVTRSPAFDAGDCAIVKIKGRAAGVRLDEVTILGEVKHEKN